MTNPLDVLFTLVIPAYVAGYLWLIKLARTDRPLYFFIESRLLPWTIAVAVITMFYLVIFIVMFWDNNEKRNVYVMLFLIIPCLTGHAISSSDFFRRITKLPPIGEQADSQEPQEKSDREQDSREIPPQ